MAPTPKARHQRQFAAFSCANSKALPEKPAKAVAWRMPGIKHKSNVAIRTLSPSFSSSQHLPATSDKRQTTRINPKHRSKAKQGNLINQSVAAAVAQLWGNRDAFKDLPKVGKAQEAQTQSRSTAAKQSKSQRQRHNLGGRADASKDLSDEASFCNDKPKRYKEFGAMAEDSVMYSVSTICNSVGVKTRFCACLQASTSRFEITACFSVCIPSLLFQLPCLHPNG